MPRPRDAFPDAGDDRWDEVHEVHESPSDAETSALEGNDLYQIDVTADKDPDALALKPENGDEGFGELEPAGRSERFGKLEPENGDICDPSSDLQVEVHPKDQSALSKGERKSIADSAKGLLTFAEQRLVSLGADVVLPGLGGRLADLAFEVRDVVNSVRALFSDDPVLEMPLPSPVPSLGFTLEIPLTSGEDGEVAPPLALFVAPDSPSLTGGWALDAGEHDDHQAQEPRADISETPRNAFLREQSKPRVGRQPAVTCLVDIDLDSLRLPRGRKPRARVLATLAGEYAPQLRKNPDLFTWFDLFIIADKGRRCGMWIWLDAEPEQRLRKSAMFLFGCSCLSVSDRESPGYRPIGHAAGAAA